MVHSLPVRHSDVVLYALAPQLLYYAASITVPDADAEALQSINFFNQFLFQTPMPRRFTGALGARLRTPETKVLPDNVHTPILQEPRPPLLGQVKSSS